MSDLQPIDIGDIRFLDNVVPQLTAGAYTVEVNHTVKEPSHKVDSAYNAVQKFIVQSPRFSVPSQNIKAQYPVQGSDTDFNDNLPYIVFDLKHLPWSRALESKAEQPFAAPWMALMIFKRDEIVYEFPKKTQGNPAMATSRPVKQIANFKSGDILGPTLVFDPIEQKNLDNLQANAIDVLGTTFQSLAPALEELPYLAHVRQINSGDDAPDGLSGEGFYSTILANRLSDPNNDTPYIAHLVSLEGWAEYLPGGTLQFAPGQIARLISLSSWTFTGKAAGASFKTMALGLNVDTLKLPFELPDAWGSDASAYTPAQKEVKKRYDEGYAALNYTTRLGENSFAWYRGPFVPVIPVVLTNIAPVFQKDAVINYITTADQAIIYDAAMGIFDQSYAIAWEIGRMITLANRPAALAIWQWKKKGIQQLQTLNRIVADKLSKQRRLQGTYSVNLGSVLDDMDWEKVKEDMLNTQSGEHQFMNYLGTTFGRHIIGNGDPEHLAALTVLDPSGLEQHLESMPGLLSKQELHDALRQGLDPHAYISQKLASAQNG